MLQAVHSKTRLDTTLARTFFFFWELGINLAEFSSIIYILKEDFYIILRNVL